MKKLASHVLDFLTPTSDVNEFDEEVRDTF